METENQVFHLSHLLKGQSHTGRSKVKFGHELHVFGIRGESMPYGYVLFISMYSIYYVDHAFCQVMSSLIGVRELRWALKGHPEGADCM